MDRCAWAGSDQRSMIRSGGDTFGTVQTTDREFLIRDALCVHAIPVFAACPSPRTGARPGAFIASWETPEANFAA